MIPILKRVAGLVGVVPVCAVSLFEFFFTGNMKIMERWLDWSMGDTCEQ